jgi:excisionase family DNA binding protein
MKKSSQKHIIEDVFEEKPSVVLFDNQLLTYPQAAKYLGISLAHLGRLKQWGKIPYVSIGKRSIRFKVGSLNSWIFQREKNK